jgi:ketosteroid isomerase-like protein
MALGSPVVKAFAASRVVGDFVRFGHTRRSRESEQVDFRRRAVALGAGLSALGASTTSSPFAVAADCREINSEAEKAALKRVEQEFASALTSADVDRLVRLFAPDIVLITRYTDPARLGEPLRAVGIEIARAFNERFLRNARNLVASITPTNIAVAQSGDLAYVVGDFEFRFEFVGQGRIVVRGRNLHIFRKIDNEWRIAVEATMEASTAKSN